MKKLLTAAFMIIIALTFASSVIASGEGAARLYNQGNAAFMKGDFETAIGSYLDARGQGSNDPRLLFNLGCAYLKAGKLGPAIQYFESAKFRAPRDADLQFNLRFAQAQTLDALPEEKPSIIEIIGGFPLKNYTESELATAAGGVFIAAFALMAVAWSYRRRKRGKAAILIALIWLCVSFVIAGYAGAHHLEYGGHRVVIGAGELAVKSGPGLDNPTVFTVHEGLTAKVRQRRGAWTYIEIPTGFTGWAPNETLLPIG